MTFKQLEALYWIAQLGGFIPAARKLNTSQSAISKRVQELEVNCGAELFDRTQRSARLTLKGEAMFQVAKDLLAHRDRAIEQLGQPELVRQPIRIGVTELTAMTWLPRLVRRIHNQYPRVVIRPVVDLSANLRDKLLADEVDLAIMPAIMEDRRFTSQHVKTLENSWMCKPGLLPSDQSISFEELTSYTLLTQGIKSGTGLMYNKWLRSLSAEASNIITSDSLVALIGMTVSGLGVSHLPRLCLEPLVASGMLQVLETRFPPPDIPYAAMYRTETSSSLVIFIAALAQECCDFTRLLQTEP
jgi:DNA-binding transcriptional LysR family regulator